MIVVDYINIEYSFILCDFIKNLINRADEVTALAVKHRLRGGVRKLDRFILAFKGMH